MGADTVEARYDAVAAWYAALLEEWGPSQLPVLVRDELPGRRVLDLACGEGRLCRVLAAGGAAVTGVDLSERLLDIARRYEQSTPAGIEYVHGDATRPDSWWDGRTFDGVVSDMALMDIDDLDGVASAVECVLAPGGWFVFTIFHPCFPGTENQRSSWAPDLGYSHEGWWVTDGVGVRSRVGANHRMVSTYINAFVSRGLRLLEMWEPDRALPFFLSARFARE
jgi:SAM-dependent methyltransferase